MKDTIKKLDQLERRNRELQVELRKLKRKHGGKIGYLLLILGFTLFALAVLYSHNVSAFIGIALTFWGALARDGIRHSSPTANQNHNGP